jgi:beta-lactamase regulating signal transducer with metallopeptidase domain/predicted  nucleic acid-binding Zn-ribbon protein
VIQIVEAAARTIVLACLAGAALWAMRDKAVLYRLRVWQAVLVVALAMPLLGSVAPQLRLPIPVPEFAAPTSSRASNADSVTTARALRPTRAHDAIARASREPAGAPYVAAWSSTADIVEPSSSDRPVPASRQFSWLAALLTIYFVIVILLLVRIVIGVACGDRLARAARPIEEAAALDALSSSKQPSGLPRVPRLVESDAASVPVTLRVSDPVILLPSTWREWEQGELAAVLAHEMSHVARRDALVQRLALIHRAIFWFSPFAWWLERHLADLAEQVSDESALECGVDRVRYAETLLGFFAALESAPERVWWQGVAMAKAGQAEKRVDRILAWRGAMRKQFKKSLVVFFAIGAIAAVGFSASVHPSLFSFQQTTPPPPAAPPQPAPATQPVVNPGPTPQAPSVAPVTPAAPATPVAAPVEPAAPAAAIAPTAPDEQDVTPEAAWPSAAEIREARERLMAARKTLQEARDQLLEARAQVSDPATKQELDSIERALRAYKKAVARYQIWTDEYKRSSITGPVSGGVYGGVEEGVEGWIEGTIHDSQPRFVIITKGSESVTMSGDSEDVDHARALRDKIPGDFIWFEHDEKPYIIRDQATVDKAKALWKPQEELGKQQEVLGKQQEALGKQQEALGEKMEQVRVKIPDMTAELQKLEKKMKELSANGGTVDQIGDLQSEIGELQSRIGEIQSDAGRQQGEVGREQGELGRKQGELGRQQGELGRRQGELAREASQQMKQLLDQAVANGTAQPE